MALPADVIWEIRTTGNDATCGGGWAPSASGSTGIDYSQQDSAQVSCIGTLSTSTSATTTLTATASPFSSALLGNIIRITSGTNFSVGSYLVSGYVDANNIILDRTPTASAIASSGVGYIGGALASIGMAGAVHTGGNTFWVKSGNYIIRSATKNVSGGCISFSNGASNRITAMFGYGTVRGDQVRPTLTASGITGFMVINMSQGVFIYDFIINCNSLAVSRGVSAGTNYTKATRVKVLNPTNNGFNATGGAPFIQCEVQNASGVAGFSGGACSYCFASGCTNTYGFQMVDTGAITNCVSSGNLNGFYNITKPLHNCIAISNSSDGFVMYDGAPTEVGSCYNCIAINSGGYGFTITTAGRLAYAELYNCAGFNNTTANYYTTTPVITTNVNFVALSGNPFVSSETGDLRLNSTTGAGAALRGTGFSGLTYILSGTPSYPDIGPFQAARLPVGFGGMSGGFEG